MNDLELLDEYCEKCLDFIDPRIFREIENRCLALYINYLPNNVLEAKAIVRARLAKIKQCFGDEEIDQIANEIKRLEALRIKLNNMNMADANKIIPVIKEMQEVSEFVLSYFNPAMLPD